MRLKIFFLLSLFLGAGFGLTAQEKAAYRIFTGAGKKADYQKLLKAARKQDVILFGEQHNNPIAHWLQLELTKDLHQSVALVLGAEMIEADNQAALDEYLAGNIDADGLDSLARLWSNYETDYAPLIDFAKAEGLTFIGTNVPRRYASSVYRAGTFEVLDSLPPSEKDWIAPMPFPFDPELPRYQNILTMMNGHGSPEMIMAQAVKDATMAHFILQNYEEGQTFIHYNGAYHSDFYEGILWYLQQKENALNYFTISTVEQSDLSKLDPEHLGRADFIICVDVDMTKTY